MRKWLLLALLLFPVAAFASSSGGGLFSVAPTDKSMEYLGLALGSIPGTPIQNDSGSAIGSLFYIFNQVVFILGILIIVYTTIVGTMHTAQEGEFLGKKWHPIFVPLRAALGVYLLLPSTAGYNWIQITVMWFIVQGVGAANTLWKQVITQNESSGSMHNDTRQVDLQNAGGTVSAIFTSNVCMLKMNSNPTVMDLMGEPISVYRWGNKIEWGRLSKAGQEQPLCGSVSLPTNIGAGISIGDSTDSTSFARTEAFAAAVYTAQATLMVAAYEAVNGGGANTLGVNSFTTAANVLKTTAANMSTTFESMDDINQESITNGWIHAGSYYFQLVHGSGGANVSLNIPASGPNSQGITELLGNTLTGDVLGSIGSTSQLYTQSTSDGIAQQPSSGKLQLSNTGTDPHVQSILSSLFGGLMDNIVDAINNEVTTGADKNDPIVSMATFGAKLTNIVEITFWGSLALIFFAWLFTSVLTCLAPLGHTMNFLLAMCLPLAVTILSLLYAAGITLGLYVPLIPYLVFTFCALGWIILVIEALLGSSLIALTLVIPSEDEIGKAGHAIIILLGLFLRPALMILGFIIAIQLLSVAVKMLNYGFWATLVASTGASAGLGVFGMIGVLLIYTAIATTMTHEAFSLIYLLPNKVLRWMGGGPEGDDDVMGKVKESKGSVEKGGAIGKGAMGGIITKFTPKDKK